MEIKIVETPIRFHLYGKSAPVPDDCYAKVGLELMDVMWKIVKETKTPTKGINHWVYPPGSSMFVGVELQPGAQPPAGLEPMEFELPRYLEHIHVGPYQALPDKWKALRNEITARGEAISFPSLEIYGHYCVEPSQLETKILIGLR